MAPKTLEFKLVDVFADSPLRGNQLAMFLDTGNLSAEEMQEIAREMNFSETTFVLNTKEDVNSTEGFRTRIFTVEEELPFAGHPTLGTSFVLQEILGKKEIILSLKVGKVNVTFVPG
jgi:trans-2,3-dihydro-3-hydroxyanthranilate isomerase